MTKVNAVGYYGWNNFGDDLFRSAVLHSRDLIWPGRPRIESFVTPSPIMHQSTGKLGQATRFAEAMVGVVWADMIALCGGSVLEDIAGTQKYRLWLASKMGKRVEALGVSLGPWKTEDARLRVLQSLRSMDRIVVRDAASYDRSEGAATLGGDLAALYPMPTIAKDKRGHLTVCVSNDAGTDMASLANLLKALLPLVDMPVKLLALNVSPQRGDLPICVRLQRELNSVHPDVQVAQYESVDQTVRLIAESRAVWSQRLHGLIVGYLCNVPILALSHHIKISDFAAHIGLDRAYLRDDVQVTGQLKEAARATLFGAQRWTITPETYRRDTERAFRSRDESGT